MPVTVFARFYLGEVYYPVGSKFLSSESRARDFRLGNRAGELTGFTVGDNILFC